jgi:beta-lactamase regulating signal transducer with metallopeptidase domain/ankyrin repeat protein
MTSIAWILVKATLILLVGLTAAAAARKAAASVRHLIMATTFVALLILPLVATIAPPNVIEVLALPAGIDGQATSSRVESVKPDRSTIPQDPARTAASAPASTTSPEISRTMLATALWAGGVGLLAAILGAKLWRLREIRRNGVPWLEGQTLLNSIARARGLVRPVSLTLHEDVAVPITYGLAEPLVVLPKDASQWEEADLRRALVHELEHVRRGDWQVQMIARGVCALYWFHPLAWVAWRRLCLEGERACDDAVLQSDEHSDYAQQLVTLAQRLSTGQRAPVLSMANRSDLSVRVRAVLDSTQLRGRAGRRTVVASIALATLVVVLLGPLSLVAVAQAPDASAEPSSVAGATTASAQSSDRQVTTRRVGRTVHRALGEALIEAAEEGDVEAVTSLLDSGIDVNTVVRGDGTALIAAARGNQLEMVRFLLDRGAEADLGVDGDGTPLINAARDAELSVVKLLVERGADLNLGFQGDGNPLIMAAGDGHVDVVRYLLDQGADIERVVPGDENPLIHACEGGHLDVVKLLLSRNANINARVWVEHDGPDQKGGWRTPLIMARRNGHRELVAYLLANGAIESNWALN